MPNRYYYRIAIGFILVIAGILAASAKELDEKTKKFLQKNGYINNTIQWLVL